ncbi:MAG: DNA-binding response regulator [Bacteroidetes bacterium]|nr:MAG: DNA-binding response regulator [Bacteroidota bacterium]
MKALILEQEEDLLDLLDYNLTRDGYEVLRSEEEGEAVALATLYQPQVVVLGNCSSREERASVCRRIRDSIGMATALILCLTTDDSFSESSFNNRMGADISVPTPVLPGVLLGLIRNAATQQALSFPQIG